MSGRFIVLPFAALAVCAAVVFAAGCNNPTNACNNFADECVTNSLQGHCVSDNSGGFQCAPACAGAVDTFTCGIGGACYYLADGKFACMGTYLGQKSPGQACSKPNDCTGGSQCVVFEKASSASTCYKACTDHCTAAGATCTDSGHGFNICTGLVAP